MGCGIVAAAGAIAGDDACGTSQNSVPATGRRFRIHFTAPRARTGRLAVAVSLLRRDSAERWHWRDSALHKSPAG